MYYYFTTIDVVEEQFGAGVPDRTTLILPLIKKEPDISEKSRAKSQAKKADEMKERVASILDILRADPTATVPRMASTLGITERQVRTVLDQMKNQQVMKISRWKSALPVWNGALRFWKRVTAR